VSGFDGGDRPYKVNEPCNLDGFTVVERLELCKLLGIAFNEISKLIDESGSLKASNVLSPSRNECLSTATSISFGDADDTDEWVE
jgi:hypothetical protein